MGARKAYVNRELRWLSFNERVLMASENESIPLMERLKFVGIFSSNLDEFYAVRVGSIHRALIDPQNHPFKGGGDLKDLLKDILHEVKRLNVRMDAVIEQLFEQLRNHRICMVDEQTLSVRQREFLDHFAAQKLRRNLFPILLDPSLEFPYLKHVTLYLAVHMYQSEHPSDFRYALVEVPTDTMARYVELPSRGGWHHIIYLEDVIRLKLNDIFKAFPYDRYDAYTIKITRDGEYDLTDEITRSLYEKLSTSIKQRSQGDPVRFVYDREMPKHMLNYLMEKAQLKECRIIIAGGRYHNARDLLRFPKVGNHALYFAEQRPLKHHTLSDEHSLLDQIEQRDHLVSLPYHRYDTAMMIATEAVDRLHSTAHSHHRIIILETMGHKVGWLALGSGLAGGADVILLPEIPYDEQVVADAILRRSREGKKFSIVVVAEGAISKRMAAIRQEEKDGEEKVEAMLKTRTSELAANLEKLTGRETRVTILGYLQRGGTPTPYDRLLSTALGSRCALEIMAENWGHMMAYQNNKIVPVPLKKVAGPVKYIPENHYLVECARHMGVCLGS